MAFTVTTLRQATTPRQVAATAMSILISMASISAAAEQPAAEQAFRDLFSQFLVDGGGAGVEEEAEPGKRTGI